MDVEIVAGNPSALSPNSDMTFAIPTETRLDPDTLPTGNGTVIYTIPTQAGVFSGAMPSGTGNEFVTLLPASSPTRKSSAIRNSGGYRWLAAFCFLQAIALLQM